MAGERAECQSEDRISWIQTAGFFLIFFVLLICGHSSLLSLPYFWDEAGYYIPAARDLLGGSLIPHSTPSNAHPPLVMAWLALIAVWFFYMPFEAYHTARKRQAGIPVDEWSSLLPRGSSGGRLPVGPIVLIAVGVLFLLDNLGLLPLSEILRFWPLILIGVGIYSLYSRLSGPLPVVPPPPPSSGHVASSPSGDVNGGAA